PRPRCRQRGLPRHPRAVLPTRTGARAGCLVRPPHAGARRMSLLRELDRINALRALDDALANTLRRLDPDTPDSVLAAAGLASLAVAQGHAGFDPAQPRLLVDADLPWPEADSWTQALAASRFVATPAAEDLQAEAAPLVFEHGLLYLRRY